MSAPKLKHLSASMLIAMSMGATPVMAEPTLEISGLIEVEINSGDDHTAAKNSDIALATVELSFDAQINENVSAHILVLHEDDANDTDTPVIDEGFISITNGYMFLNAGRMYVPFGHFETHMISDPLTLEIAETQESAVQIGYQNGGYSASIYAFNGDADKSGTDNDVIDDFGISISYTKETDSMNFDVGIDYINNMAETDGIQDALANQAPTTVEEHTAGMALHAIINMDKLNIIAEYISASDDFNTIDIGFNGDKAKPSASNIEVAYTMDIGGREMTFAVAHQTSSDIDGSALPETRNMISASTSIFDDVGLIIEYTDASDYETSDGGTGESGGMLTAQLAVEF